MRAAVVGLGQMGLQHISTLGVLTGQRVCVFDSNLRLAELAGKMSRNLCVHRSLEDLTAEGDTNVFYVCTPVQTHEEIVRNILKTRGDGALFVEKPLSTDYTSARRMAELVSGDRIINMVGFQKRFNGVYAKLKELLDNGVLGEVKFYRAHSFSFDVTTKLNGWKFQPSTGGATLDYGAHMMDILIWLYGEPSVRSSSFERVFSEQVEDYTIASLQHTSIEGLLEVGWSMRNYYPNEHVIEVHGTSGTAVASDDELTLILDKESNGYRAGMNRFNFTTLTPTPRYLLTYPEYTLEDQYFLNCVSAGSKPRPDFSDAAKVNRLADSIREAFRSS